MPRMRPRLLQRLLAAAVADSRVILLGEGLLKLLRYYLGRARLEVTGVLSAYEEGCLLERPLEEARGLSFSIINRRCRSLLNLLRWTLFE